MKQTRSEQLFARAREVIPGGVNSPVRAFRAVGGTPLFIARGEAQHLVEAAGRRYLDFACSSAPLILGHAPPAVLRALGYAAAGRQIGPGGAQPATLAHRPAVGPGEDGQVVGGPGEARHVDLRGVDRLLQRLGGRFRAQAVGFEPALFLAVVTGCGVRFPTA